MDCPYCGKEAKFLTSKEFYGKDYYNTNVYVCYDCDAHVGTHRGSKTPLGTLANHKLRSLRRMCHQHFDLLWKNEGYSRTGAYRWLQREMELPPEDAHIGRFTVEQCMTLLRKFGVRIR